MASHVATTSTEPLISIGMAVRNAQDTLSLTITSVLFQTYPNWELIILDDGSTDGTLEIALTYDDPRIKVMSDGSSRGLAARLNQAMDLGHGKYFARLDADDVAYPARLAKQLEYLETHPEIDLVATGAVAFTKDGVVIGKFRTSTDHEAICARPWVGFSLPHPSWVGRIEWFRAHRYRERLDKAQDQEFLVRTFATSRFACLPEVLMGYRVDGLSIRKTVLGRLTYGAALWRQAGRSITYGAALRGIVTHAAKAVRDIFSVLSGLDSTIIRYRFSAASPEEVRAWQFVWDGVRGGYSQSTQAKVRSGRI